jgi:hypothetical protein
LGSYLLLLVIYESMMMGVLFPGIVLVRLFTHAVINQLKTFETPRFLASEGEDQALLACIPKSRAQRKIVDAYSPH